VLEDSHQPIFGEAAKMQLPAISRIDFLEYLDFQFEQTGRPARCSYWRIVAVSASRVDPLPSATGFSSHSRVRPALVRLQGRGPSTSATAAGTSSTRCSASG
jgi:hypothetical protein